MALVDHKLYRAIKPNELLHLNWTKPNKANLSPNVLKMIKQFNNVGEWVIHIISSASKDSVCVKALVRIIDIAYESYKLANFNGAMALLSGLKHNIVSKRKEIWVCFVIIILICNI